jgi:DNA topoisomerase-1
MSKTLVIVESPGKIKKIQSILGDNYHVIASVGHILDLDKLKMSIDIDNSFEPHYITMPGKEQVINNIKSSYKKSSDILIATDEDREGEMIAWSIAKILNIDLNSNKRILFNSITHDEILNAVKNPKTINQPLVNAQKTRRILDRIVGYELSPLLIKNIGPKLSAGRVQSVVTKIIIDKYQEYKNFLDNISNSYYKTTALFDNNLNSSLHDYKKKPGDIHKIQNKDQALNLLELLKTSNFHIHDIINKKSISNPPPPFTTSTMQQEASNKLNMDIKTTMTAAQKLYESGYITYMRTDSTSICKEALNSIKKYILEKYGENYYRSHIYTNKKNNTQEAHEAIRPTNLNIVEIKAGTNTNEQRLYNLIYNRTVGSQMKPAEYDITNIIITSDKLKDLCFMTSISRLKFLGYLILYNKNLDQEHNINYKIGDKLNLTSAITQEEYKQPPNLYTESTLIDTLDPSNLNIGRPSTYAEIINKITSRNYVTKADLEGVVRDVNKFTLSTTDYKINHMVDKIKIGSQKSKFIPTILGITVNNFLVSNFSDILDYKFTSNIELKLDEIADNNSIWTDVLKEFYETFHKNIVAAKDNIINTDKLLGTDISGINIYAAQAKYGPIVKKTVGKKTIYGPIKDPYTIDNITLEQAIIILEYPKVLGKYKNKNVVLKKGMYGLYIKWGPDNIQVTDQDKEYDLESLIEIIDNKIANQPPVITDGKYNYTVLTGIYGRYIKAKPIKNKTLKSFNISLPKDLDPNTTIDLEYIKQLKTKKFEKKPRKYWNNKKK